MIVTLAVNLLITVLFIIIGLSNDINQGVLYCKVPRSDAFYWYHHSVVTD